MNAAVLAGGKGSRMNYRDKSKLILNERSFLHTIISQLIDFKKIMVITNREKSEYDEIIADFHCDLISGIGPLGGILTALEKSDEHNVFITTCDMPFITTENIRKISFQTDFDIVVPVFNGKYEMLFASYSTNCIPRIKEMIREKKYKITGLFDDPELKVRKISVDESFLSTLRNINTVEEYNSLASH